MDALNFRTLIDPLYGQVPLDGFLAELISQPEMQRLRDVRLSNINSLLMPGGANVSRFEHSVGTAVLARFASRSLRLSERDEKRLVCAALLHDVAITPFGHLMEEAFHLAGRPFDHESRLRQIFLGEAEIGNMDRQIYRGRPVGFRGVLGKTPYRSLQIDPGDILELTQGVGPLGALIKNSIDLDNTDNVARMAHHIGIPYRRSLSVNVAESFRLAGGVVCFDADHSSLLEEWLDLRRRLYSVFMTNPLDFSAKAMLIEAIREAIEGTKGFDPVLDEASWSLTDSELLEKLRAFEPARHLVARFELADFYDILGFYWVNASAIAGGPGWMQETREKIAEYIGVSSDDILLYWIRDKRTRPISNLPLLQPGGAGTTSEREIGGSPDKSLFGVVVGKKNWITRKLVDACREAVANALSADVVTPCISDRHLADAFEVSDLPRDGQLNLF